MSRYFILLLFTIPFVVAGVTSTVTQYKLKSITKKRFWFQILFWSLIFIGLFFTEKIYNTLIDFGLTNTDSLSLFDVIQVTAILALTYIINRLLQKTQATEKRLRELHQELSILLSTTKRKKK